MAASGSFAVTVREYYPCGVRAIRGLRPASSSAGLRRTTTIGAAVFGGAGIFLAEPDEHHREPSKDGHVADQVAAGELEPDAHAG